MALIADLCPHCQRITRCNVVERGAIVGGILLGVHAPRKAPHEHRT